MQTEYTPALFDNDENFLAIGVVSVTFRLGRQYSEKLTEAVLIFAVICSRWQELEKKYCKWFVGVQGLSPIISSFNSQQTTPMLLCF